MCPPPRVQFPGESPSPHILALRKIWGAAPSSTYQWGPGSLFWGCLLDPAPCYILDGFSCLRPIPAPRATIIFAQNFQATPKSSGELSPHSQTLPRASGGPLWSTMWLLDLPASFPSPCGLWPLPRGAVGTCPYLFPHCPSLPSFPPGQS